jgi:hypothetical protein
MRKARAKVSQNASSKKGNHRRLEEILRKMLAPGGPSACNMASAHFSGGYRRIVE